MLSVTTLAMSLENIRVGNTTRTIISYAPQGLPSQPALVIACHGMNQDAPYLQNEAKWELVADTAKFVVVYANGENRSWDISGNKDIQFMEAIIDTMYQRHHINRSRVYLTGFSMGGMFTYHCANRMADKIAAFAPVSGYNMGGPNANASRPVPLIHTHGTGDDVCVYSPVQSHIDAWVRFDGCDQTPVIEKPQSGPANTPATIKRYKHGRGGVEVALLTFKDKGHWWSMDTAQGLTSVEIWNFCRRYSLGAEEPELQSIVPEAHSFDLQSDCDRTFTLTFNDSILLDGVHATMSNGTQNISLEVVGGEPSQTVVCSLPAGAEVADGRCTLTLSHLVSTKGGTLESVSFPYTYGVQEVGECLAVDTLYCPDWYSEREAIGEGIPTGWKRINTLSDGSKETTAQGTANVAGVRMKYFERGGDMDAGIYFSARDNSLCQMRFGAYKAARLNLTKAGGCNVSFRSTYWSAGAQQANATFSLYVRNFSMENIFQMTGIRSQGTMNENTAQPVRTSALHSYDFAVPADGEYLLDFEMSEGWNSVIFGNIVVTTQPTDADRYKGTFYRTLLECQRALAIYEPSAARETLATVVAQYESLVSTSPSVYQAATQALRAALDAFLATSPVLGLDQISVADSPSSQLYDLMGRPLAHPAPGVPFLRNRKIVITY